MNKYLVRISMGLCLLLLPFFSMAMHTVDGDEITVPGEMCQDNLPPALKVGDPACWAIIPGSYLKTCKWEPMATECTRDAAIDSIELDDEEGVVGNDYMHYWVAFDYYDLGGIYSMDGSVGICKSKMIYDYNVATAGTSDEVRDQIEAWQASIESATGISNVDEWKESWNDPCPDGEAGSTCIDTIYANTCGPMTCTNMSPFPPVDYTELVDAWDSFCYYTTVDEWGLPDSLGTVYATKVTQHVTQNEAECVSEPNFKSVSPIADIKAKGASDINYSDGLVSVNKDEGLDLEWSSQYATSCLVPGDNTGVEWVGAKDLSGLNSINVSGTPKPLTSSALPTTMSYKLTCLNLLGTSSTDSVDVSVTCTPNLDPVWGECDKSCGPGAQQHRTLVYGNCFTESQTKACDPVPSECPVVSDWREVQP